MKLARFAILALSACAAVAHAEPRDTYRVATPVKKTQHGIRLIDVSTLAEPGMADSATGVFGYPGKRMGLSGMGEPHAAPVAGTDNERGVPNNRAWGVSIGVAAGPVTFRVARQNKNVTKVAPAMALGNRVDAKNTIVAANVDFGAFKAYTAYSANRGWGGSPLWNPDNPYGAALASTPSTDSRDVLVGIAVPMGKRTTMLASFIRKNDRDLANRDADQMAFGATYALSRRADFYAAFSHTALRGRLAGQALMSTRGSSAINLGMRHSF